MATESDYPTPRNPASSGDASDASRSDASRSDVPRADTPRTDSAPADARVPDGIPLPSLSRNMASTGEKSAMATNLERRVAELQRQEATLKREIAALQSNYDRAARPSATDLESTMARVVTEALTDLEQRRKTLQLAVEQLERRQERIQAEMRTTFAGASQDLAIRVQGFKDYLVGSLQDLAAAAEQLELSAANPPVPPSSEVPVRDAPMPERSPNPQFAKPAFRDDTQFIRDLIDQYRSKPDYYGPPWQLRRTFEPLHAERVSKWFFELGGRGAVRSTGSRLQNILVSSAIISILVEMYGERLYTLVLANSPERLGEWRRGLQDCLGISRGDFGAEQGVMLFEAPEPLAQRADRLVQRGQLPLVIVDEAEEFISLSLLQFPLWLAFAPDPTRPPVI
jgi:chaperonin cofactor prefoldin